MSEREVSKCYEGSGFWFVLESLYYILRLYIHGFIEMILQGLHILKQRCQQSASNSISHLNVQDHVAIVTGGSSGIGLQISNQLAKQGAQVVVAGPSPCHFNKTITDGSVLFMELDLGSFTSIQKFVQGFKAKYNRLDLLVNNAGVMLIPYKVTEQGFEGTYGINYIGHVYLITLLLDYMPLESETSKIPKIINISSSVHCLGSVMELLCLKAGTVHKARYCAHKSYILSKLAIVLFSKKLAIEMSKKNKEIVVFSIHPGIVNSGLYQHVFYPLQLVQQYLFAPFFFKSVSEGAESILKVLSSDYWKMPNGSYIANGEFLSYDVTTEELDSLWMMTHKQIRDALDNLIQYNEYSK